MKVHILGGSTDDIGTQLEQLTTIILEREGYTGYNCNKITYGGGEIDVCARKSEHNVIYWINRSIPTHKTDLKRV